MHDGSYSYRVGDATVRRIDESTLADVEPAKLYPDLDGAALKEHGPRLTAGSYNPDNGRLIQSLHSWLVRVGGRTILIDTATGDGKDLPPPLGHLQTPYLERLAAAGVRPEAVDSVLLTHLHADHVGWNTRRENGGTGRWVPTFPNARHVLSRVEQRYLASLTGGEPAPDLPPPALGTPVRTPTASVYAESIAPVIAAGLTDFIEVDGGEWADGFSFHPTPGHSVDHATIRLRSRGEEALFLGDVFHHPLQVYRPDLRSVYCEFPEPARTSRRWALEYAADRHCLCFSSHFAETSAGRITRRGDGFAWRFVQPQPR